jgi:hypothetical protein
VIPVSESPHDMCFVYCALYKINCALALFSQAVFRIEFDCEKLRYSGDFDNIVQVFLLCNSTLI